LIQLGAVGFSALIAANAVYLARLASQTASPGPVLSKVAEWGLFPFGVASGTLSIEDYCPFGPVEGLFRFIKSTCLTDGVSFVGPVTLRNLGILLAVLGLVLLTKKTFCSWLCPFGALFDFIGWISKLLGIKKLRPNDALDRRLRGGRHFMLIGIVALTAWSGTLIFKEVDPFFALYSLGSNTRSVVAYGILGILLCAALFLPGIWCHYLCPMGSFMDPFSRLGRIRLVRSPEHCNSCRLCARACPQRIPVHVRKRIVDAQCTNCLNCLSACPKEEALELRLEGRL